MTGQDQASADVTMEQNTASSDLVKSKFAEISPFLDEKMRRIWAATEARATGIARPQP